MDRNKSVDFFRYLLSFFVVSIHANLGNELGRIPWLMIQTVSRIAVPFFCMVTGHYYCKKISTMDTQMSFVYTLTYLKRLIKSYLVVSFPYLIIKVVQFEKATSESILELLKELLITGVWGHLWYFPAVILSIVMLYLLKFRFKLSRAVSFLSVLLYCFSCLGDAYSGLIEKSEYLSILFHSDLYLSFFRGFIYAFCFITLGGGIEKVKSKLHIGKKKAFHLSIVFMGALFAEQIITNNMNWNTKLTLAFFYYPFMIMFMCWILEDPLSKRMNDIFFDYRCAANFTYYFHPLLLACESKVIDNSLLLWSATALLLLLFNWIGQRYIPKIYFYIAN